MSHCPGYFLEDWITDVFRVVDEGGDHGTGIRRLYSGQLILTGGQFKKLVEIFEPLRERIENALEDFLNNEDERGSWRDFRSSVFDFTDDKDEEATKYLASLKGKVPETQGIVKQEGTPMDMIERYVRDMVKNGFMNGWMGDTSEEFIQGQIKEISSKSESVRRGMADSVINLVQYCGWSREDVEELARSFDFEIVEDDRLVAGVMGVI